MFCFHKYKIEKTIEVESAFEQMVRSNAKTPSALDEPCPNVSWLFKRSIVSIISCEKCGRVKHIKTVCPKFF